MEEPGSKLEREISKDFLVSLTCDWHTCTAGLRCGFPQPSGQQQSCSQHPVQGEGSGSSYHLQYDLIQILRIIDVLNDLWRNGLKKLFERQSNRFPQGYTSRFPKWQNRLLNSWRHHLLDEMEVFMLVLKGPILANVHRREKSAHF